MDHTAQRSVATVPRDCRELLTELSIALHKFSMYPSGHPALAPVVTSLVARVHRVVAPRGQLAIGVTKRQLVVDGAGTDHSQPVLRRLAETLHAHLIGGVSLDPGLEAVELSEALQALALEPEQHGALGAMPPRGTLEWPHLRLHRLTFDGLSLTETDGTDANMPDAGHGGLWMELARAALLDGDMAHTTLDDHATDATTVARAIESRRGAGSFDAMVFGCLMQVAQELRASGSPGIDALRQRTTRLVRALSNDTLARLIRTCGDPEQRHVFLRDSVHGMAVEAVIDVLRAAAEAHEQTISHGLIRMLTKLAAQATRGPEAARPLADVAFRDQVQQLLQSWRLADPNPTRYGSLLQHLASSSEAEIPVDPSPLDSDPLRLVHMSLECGGSGPMVDRAIEEAVARGHTVALLGLLSSPGISDEATQALRERLLQPAVLVSLLSRPEADGAELDRLQRFMSLDHYRAMLDVLATSDNRTVRRRLIERLATTEMDLGELIVAFLDDPRWFVQRNMLLLLERIGRLPRGFEVARWAAHDDVRVRQQAIRLWLQFPDSRHLAVRAALDDGHPRLVHSGLFAIQHDCPASLAPAVGRVALNPGLEPELRGLAARALGSCRDRGALDTLLALTDGGRTIFGRQKLPPRSGVTVAALRALAMGWRADPAASERLRLAEAANDADLRQAVEASHR